MLNVIEKIINIRKKYFDELWLRYINLTYKPISSQIELD